MGALYHSEHGRDPYSETPGSNERILGIGIKTLFVISREEMGYNNVISYLFH